MMSNGIRSRGLGIARRQGRKLQAGLQVRLAVGAAEVAERLERPTMADRGQDILQLAILAPGVVDVVRDDDRQAQLRREPGGLGDEPVVVRSEVMRQLEEEAGSGHVVATTPEDRRVALGHDPRPVAVADQEAPGDLALAAAGERQQSLGVLDEERLAEPRNPLRAGQVGV